jgi:multidrug efflux pump subunit AcrB
VRNANRSFLVGNLREAGGDLQVMAGQTLQGVPDVGQLLITTRDGRPVYVRDVATVVVAGRPEEHRAWHLVRAHRNGAPSGREHCAGETAGR